MTKPGFFIVGAPKAGTTSLYHYLRQHPQLFLPEQKELNFFASDLFPEYIDEAVYLDLFAKADPRQQAGEASVWYLYSRAAAENIHRFDPRAKIIIMLRDPVEMLYSLHSQHYFQGMEPNADFRSALAVSEQRETEPEKSAPLLRYRAVGRYSEQVVRYLERFGKERVHIILYDDFKADTLESYRSTLDFLGVDPEFTPDLQIHNPNKSPRSRLLRSLSQLPPGLLQPLRRIIPFSLRRRLITLVTRLNIRHETRPPLDAALARSLRQELAPDVRRLAELIGHDLGAWLPRTADGISP